MEDDDGDVEYILQARLGVYMVMTRAVCLGAVKGSVFWRREELMVVGVRGTTTSMSSTEQAAQLYHRTSVAQVTMAPRD